MPKKRQQKKKYPSNSKKKREAAPGSHRKARSTDFKSRIIALLYKESDFLSLDDILKKISPSTRERKSLQDDIYELVNERILARSGKQHFKLRSNNRLFEGKLETNAKGFGFVTNLSPTVDKKTPSKDTFISKYKMSGAFHGDEVLVIVDKVRKDGKPEGTIITVLKRATDRIAGFYKQTGDRHLVTPEDLRYPFQIDIGKPTDEKVQQGDAVIVQIKDSRPGAAFINGSIIEVLGPPDSVDVQMKLVIEKHALPYEFSPEALAEAMAYSDDVGSEENREDLRKIPHVTIDGETAKDFDDAISVTKLRKGYRLYVSIADVSHFVKPGSQLDKEAYERGTSIYFPGRVIPMLPENLSNNLCSLIPDQDRLAFTAILDFDREGNLLEKDFCKSIIRSHKRFTYNTVQKIIVDNDKDIRKENKDFLTPLKWAQELAEQLQLKREKRGSIGFNLPEPYITLEEDGKIAGITRSDRFFAHQLIEEFMLAANEAVAATFTESDSPALYRIHEIPSPEKVEEFVTFAKTLDLHLPEHETTPSWFAEVLNKVKGTPKEYIFNNLLLRTMQQARYSPENKEHFGLAATDYTHFTSPIRRYPDLHVHRRLMHLIRQKKSGLKLRAPSKEQLIQWGTFLSARERTAITAERDINDRLKIFFMEKYIGDSFEAIISGVTSSALFIEITEPFVNGSIAIEELKSDYFLHDSKRHRLIGDTSMKTYQIGDAISVKLVNVDKQRKRLNFTITEEKNQSISK